MSRPLGHTSSVPTNNWTERAWVAIARETTNSGRSWRKPGQRPARLWPVDFLHYLGKRVARTRPPEPSTDEIVAAAVTRRWPDTWDGERECLDLCDLHCGQERPNLRDLFYDLLMESPTNHNQVEIMRAFDTAQSAITNGLAKGKP